MIYRGQKAICTFRPPDGPGTLRGVWEVTNSCNLSCRHCCTNTVQAEAARLEAWQLDLPRAMAEAGVREAYLSGGEPLLVPNLPSLLERFLEAGIRPVFASNGMLVPKRLPELPVGVQTLISLDWPEAELHDRFRGRPGSHSQAVAAMEALSSQGRLFHVSTVLHEGFLGEPEAADRLAEMACRHGATAIVFSRQVAVGRADQAVVPSVELAARIERLAERLSGRLWVVHPRLSTPHEPDGPLGRCHGGRSLFHITAAGDVGPCSYAVKMLPCSIFGNIGTDSFASLVQRGRNSDFVHRVDRWLQSLEDRCRTCRHAERCERGCPLFCVASPFDGLDPECPQAGASC